MLPQTSQNDHGVDCYWRYFTWRRTHACKQPVDNMRLLYSIYYVYKYMLSCNCQHPHELDQENPLLIPVFCHVLEEIVWQALSILVCTEYTLGMSAASPLRCTCSVMIASASIITLCEVFPPMSTTTLLQQQYCMSCKVAIKITVRTQSQFMLAQQVLTLL